MTRGLVVNADDLGLTTRVNAGIFDAHDRGILTSASLFANAPATGSAIAGARSRPSLGIGVHLALVDGTPIVAPPRIPTLVEDDGRFRRSWRPFIFACLSGKVSLAEVELELTAQIDRLRSEGVTLTHLDAHKHVHAYPPVFAIVARLAARFGIPTVRVPYEGLRRWSAGADRSRGTLWRQRALNAAMRPWSRRDVRTAARYQLAVPRFAGRVHTGILDSLAFAELVRDLRPGITELMVHPGYVDRELEDTGTRLLASREVELDLLCRPESRALLVEERVELCRHGLTSPMKRSVHHVS